MKCMQKYRVLGTIIAAFIFFNVFVMSDSGYVDENNLIYSDATNGRIGIGTDSPVVELDVVGQIAWGGTGATLGNDQGASIELKGNGTPYLDFTNDSTTDYDARIILKDNDKLAISGANVGINTDNPDEKLTVNGKIKCSGEIISTNSNSFRDVTGSFGLFHRNDGTNYYILLTNADDQYGTWNDLRPFRINNASGNVYIGPNSLNVIHSSGRVGIGTTNPDEKLTVNGNIHAEKVIVSGVSADFVFEDDYNLRPLNEVESFISENGHLPEIPSAKEVETHGIELAEMNAKLLQKIEELTLYMIEQNKCMLEQDKRIAELEKKLSGNE